MSRREYKKVSNFITGAFSTLFGIWLLFQGVKLGASAGKMTGPGLFPAFIGIVLFGLGVALLLSKETREQLTRFRKHAKCKLLVRSFPPSAFFSGLCLLYVLVLSHIHFIPLTASVYFTMAIIIAVSTNTLSKKVLVISGVIALGISVGIYLLFNMVFKVLV
ncbi:MAG: hypothetical protein DRP27_06020 [Thermotogae bacterium]|mgnify:CR=1 FL=1|nr:MAG: hypothetical protein DRP27_06020 [Thermotogota bacterium]